jgi:hypothetical protein
MDDCCNISKEFSFVIAIIESFEKALAFIGGTHFGKNIYSQKQYTDEARQSETSTLNDKGIIALAYVMIFKEPYPCDPTPEQFARIGQLWDQYENNKIRKNKKNELCRSRSSSE